MPDDPNRKDVAAVAVALLVTSFSQTLTSMRDLLRAQEATLDVQSKAIDGLIRVAEYQTVRIDAMETLLATVAERAGLPTTTRSH